MLDTETKRKIDSCRDILVGKIPDPKAQVEQITIALMYKFMDDMDKDAVEIGGNPSFFVEEYEQYSWSNLMSSKLGGEERINLYAEAILKMPQNPHIPQLFRDIFKGAFLPYRAPETLRLFLKEINAFTYDHSEKLGDAYEYLLSIMSSQGDAGQFRTPRNIIDFIVEVVDPKKDETVLDPACGTAGFLISGYKHILKNNKDKLNPTQKEKLMNNFVGYDISPDMVKISRVNMYLHKFPNPNIYEYDTLSSQKRWDETFDIVMANPPFMSPKGGIIPHNRFTVKSKRSEVLFVDYIREHLNIDGRAGVIIPEGIIFQTQNAYKQLRKTLIEANYLYTVISLPAGVFNPYSAVKTSILLMDRNLSKKTDSILFVKIENDGFNLGAQRRPIDKNDLPKAVELIKNYRKEILKGKAPAIAKENNSLSHIVKKEKIAEDSDYNLSGDRYKESSVIYAKYELIKVKDSFIRVSYPNKIKTSEYLLKGSYPIVDQSEKHIAGYWDNIEDVFKINKPVVLFGDHTRIFKYIDFDFVLGADGIKIMEPTDEMLPKYYYYVLKSIEIKNLGYSRHFKELKEKKFPLPPLEVQKDIIAELESYQKIIDGAKQIADNYKPTIRVDSSWQTIEIEKLCDLMTGGTPKSTIKEYYGGKIKWLVSGDIHKGHIYNCNNRITQLGLENSNAKYLPVNSVLIALNGQGKTRGSVALLKIKATCNQSIVSMNAKDNMQLLSEYLYVVLKSMYQQIRNITGDNQRSGLNMQIIKKIKIPLAPIKEQRRIVSAITDEQKIINQNKKLIETYEKRIEDRISAVWSEN